MTDTTAVYTSDALKIIKREIEAREAFPAEYDSDITNAMKVLVLGCSGCHSPLAGRLPASGAKARDGE